MSVMSALSRYLFHPLYDLKEGQGRRLPILRELNRTQWLPLETLRGSGYKLRAPDTEDKGGRGGEREARPDRAETAEHAEEEAG